MSPKTFSGQCYCGATRFHAAKPPSVVTYCHCTDCRRVTGAPVAAFAAFDISAVTFSPDARKFATITTGVKRGFCTDCGSPLTGQYDYLPDTIYISVGLIDQADDLPPALHAHAGSKLHWLQIDDDLERFPTSARNRLNR